MDIRKILKAVEKNGKNFLIGVRKGYLTFFFLIPFWILLMVIWFDDIGDCTSNGNVWDYDKDYCRDDCLLWNKNVGCVEFSQEMMKQLKACADDDCQSRLTGNFIEELCLKYKLPYNKEHNQCFWEFTPELCHKLSGNWQYPEVCAAKNE